MQYRISLGIAERVCTSACLLLLHSLYSTRTRKLARLRAQLLEPAPGASSGGGTGFDVSKSGDARIALVGFPSVGKSTFLSKITKTKSEVAAYSFTTLTAIPGVLEYGGAEIQVLDLPGIIEGASEGKGRGRQVISAAKVSIDAPICVAVFDQRQTSDLILMILDATKRAEQRALLEGELEAVGIRLNRESPYVNVSGLSMDFALTNTRNIYLKAKKAGGMKITFQAPPKNLDEKMLYNILRDYKMLNCEVLVGFFSTLRLSFNPFVRGPRGASSFSCVIHFAQYWERG